jgi:pyridoxamine 5'-phosphate oxidase
VPTSEHQPLEILDRWLEEAAEAGEPTPRAMTLATASADGRPSARVVSLKRLQDGALVFTTGLWTRKADELRRTPSVAAVFHWPTLGRQARIEGKAEVAERRLAEELFADRPRGHQLQALVSRQGEMIAGLDPLRERLEALRAEIADGAIECPPDWGAIRVVPEVVELWREEPDRLHVRDLYEAGEGGWRHSLLAP